MSKTYTKKSDRLSQYTSKSDKTENKDTINTGWLIFLAITFVVVYAIMKFFVFK